MVEDARGSQGLFQELFDLHHFLVRARMRLLLLVVVLRWGQVHALDGPLLMMLWGRRRNACHFVLGVRKLRPLAWQGE